MKAGLTLCGALFACALSTRARAELPTTPTHELLLDGSVGLFPYLGVTPALTYRYQRFALTGAAAVGFTLHAGTAQEASLGLGLVPILSPRLRGFVLGTVGVLAVQNVAVQYACGPGWFAFDPCNSGLDATVPFVGVRIKVLGSAAPGRAFAGATLGLDYALAGATQAYRSCHEEDDWLFGTGTREVCDTGTASLTRFLLTAQVSLGVSLL